MLMATGCSTPTDAPTPPPGVDLSSYEAAEGNGLWLRTGGDVTSIVAQTMRAAGPVHIVGQITETVQADPQSEPVPGRTMTIDFRGTATAFSARLTAGDVEVTAVVSAEGSRVRGNAAFVRQNPGRVADAVVCSVGLDPVLDAWGPVLDPTAFVTSLLDGAGVAANPPTGDAETIEVVTGEEGSVVGVLTVDRHGPPLPRSFVAADPSGEGSLQFTEWGEPVDLEAATNEMPCTEES